MAKRLFFFILLSLFFATAAIGQDADIREYEELKKKEMERTQLNKEKEAEFRKHRKSMSQKLFYVGIGGSWAIQALGIHELASDDKQVIKNLDVQVSDTWGANARVGIHYNEIFSGEFAFNYVNSFDWEDSYMIDGGLVNGKVDIEVYTFTLAGKIHPPLGQIWWFRPYAILGGGVMDAYITTEGTVHNRNIDSVNNETHPCLMAGLGADFFLYNFERVSIGVEGAFWMGFQEADEIQYTTINVNVQYHF